MPADIYGNSEFLTFWLGIRQVGKKLEKNFEENVYFRNDARLRNGNYIARNAKPFIDVLYLHLIWATPLCDNVVRIYTAYINKNNWQTGYQFTVNKCAAQYVMSRAR